MTEPLTPEEEAHHGVHEGSGPHGWCEEHQRYECKAVHALDAARSRETALREDRDRIKAEYDRVVGLLNDMGADLDAARSRETALEELVERNVDLAHEYAERLDMLEKAVIAALPSMDANFVFPQDIEAADNLRAALAKEDQP